MNEHELPISEGTEHWPPALQRAVLDTYTYCLSLKNGTVFYFERAEPLMNGEWVSLTITDERDLHTQAVLLKEFAFGRGVQVRVSEIAWVADSDS